MNTAIVAGVLTTVRSILGWWVARQSGDRTSAIEVLTSLDISGFGLDDEAVELINYGRAGLTYLSQRGVVVEDAIRLIEIAESEGRDVTSDDVRFHLDLAQVELDDTQQMIDSMGSED